MRRESYGDRPMLRQQAIVERGRFGDPGEASPPPSMRQQRERDHDGPPVRPIGPRPWASSSTSVVQLDLSGQPVEVKVPPAPVPVERGQQQALAVTVPRQYHSTAWGGTVTEAPLDLSAPGPGLDDHNRPASLMWPRPHRCPGAATCPERWLTDAELAELEREETAGWSGPAADGSV